MKPWIAGLLLATTAAAQAAPSYRLTLLPDLPGGETISQAVALNNQGVAGGQSVSSLGYVGAVWAPGGAGNSIGDLPGGYVSSLVYGLNDAGVAAGTSNGSGGTRAVRWSAQGGLQDLGELPGGSAASGANAINNGGTVVGYSYSSASGSRPVATLWSAPGVMQALGDLPGGVYSSVAQAVNDQGLVVGYSNDAAGVQAFRWTPDGGMAALAAPTGSNHSEAYGVNGLGWAVGSSIVPLPGGGNWQAMLWRDGQVQSLGDLAGGSTISYAFDVNDQGLVVGTGHSANGARAVLWREDLGMLDLNALVTDLPTNLVLAGARAVNEQGAIAGHALQGSQYVGFVLTPVPEPGTLALWAAGLGIVVLKRRARRA